MNVKACTSAGQPALPTGGLSRRRCLGRGAGLLGGLLGLWGLAPPVTAGPRERALRTADFYRPHHLAG